MAARRLPPLLLALGLAACAARPAPPAAPASPAPALAAATAAPAACKDEDDWTEPTPPRRIHGETWYVGSCGISVLLIATPAGMALIDSGPAPVAAQVLANLRTLGVDPHAVRYLLASHAHADHVGGMAALQAATGAPVLALPAAAAVLRSGRVGSDDPQAGVLEPFAPVADVREIRDGDVLPLGQVQLVAHATPGHTPGGTSWSWNSCAGERCVQAVYADSLSAISDDHYRYRDHPAAVARFRHSLDTLAALPCDLLLTPHPGASGQWARLRGQAPLLEAGACRAYAARARAGLEARLAQEQADTRP